MVVSKKPKTPKTLTDENGIEILAKHLDPVVVERDMLVEDIINKVQKKEEELRRFKKECFEKINNFLSKTAKRYHENWLGNASLANFANTKQVSLKISKILCFDERLSIAKSKIDAFLREKTVDADSDLRTLVLKVFNVDKRGNVDFKQIISLKQYKFDHPLWKEAMNIIDDAVQVVSSKEYIMFATRKDPKKEWQSLILNFASLDTEE